MGTTITSPTSSSLWHPQPTAWAWLNQMVERACRANPFLDRLSQAMSEQTGTRLVDWLDYVAVDRTDADDATLRQVGFAYCADRRAWVHDGGLFPLIPRVQARDPFPTRGLAVKVESVDAFVAAHRLIGTAEVIGAPGANLRYAVVTPQSALSCVVVERHGNPGWVLETPTADQLAMVRQADESFLNRPRPLVDPQAGFVAARERFDRAAEVLGQDWACDRYFAAERAYWQSRNRAARVQRARQDRLGLGWANHDHHTYRCSREHFATLIQLLEHMGFVCRERFYAGEEAGWGAQVLEQPHCGLVVFADVDLSPGEVAGDFPHEGLPPRAELGTVGVWCKLHGEAAMHAGMHHLECQFDFDAARAQLASEGIETMAPFTDFPFLRQAFTQGETWQVAAEHLQRLVATGSLTAAQAAQFASAGARGSHLEILERNDGYKGFNQTGISEIIARTDPRHGK